MTTARKPRILLAEDEILCRDLLKAILKSMNCEIVGEASNGVQAVEMYGQLKPDMMFLDINMPFKTGDEVLEEILAASPDAFVIVVSSVTDTETVSRCIEMGAANYIRKDTPVAEIKNIIKESWSAVKKKA